MKTLDKKQMLTAVVSASALVLFFAGCGRPTPEGFPKLVPCSVSVVQDGKPLEGAVVSFNGDDETKWGISGTTDASGVAKMYTRGTYPGSPKGDYKVTIQKHVVEGAEFSERSASLPAGSGVGYDLVDLKFKTVDSTPLTIRVDGKTSESFDVGAAVREAVKAL